MKTTMSNQSQENPRSQEPSQVLSLSPRAILLFSAALFACLFFLPSCASTPVSGTTGNSASQYPKEHARGAQLFRKKCQECHGLHAPSRRSDAQWAQTMHEMAWEADLNEEQESLILAYLQAAN